MRLTLPKTAPGKRWRTYLSDRCRRAVVRWHQKQRNKAIRRKPVMEDEQ